MDGFDRKLTHSLFGLRVDLTDNKDAYQCHSSATAECNGNSSRRILESYPRFAL